MQLTADNVTLYTTLEMFVRPFREDQGPNMLVEMLGESSMVAVIDLFFLPTGPRLRDKISHV